MIGERLLVCRAERNFIVCFYQIYTIEANYYICFMEDLLKEEEFLAKKDNYNPWKGFLLFYEITVLYFIDTLDKAKEA